MQMFYPESHQLRSDLHELILMSHELTSTPEDKARLQEKIEEVRINPKKYLHISQRGQDLYKKYTIHRNAAELFFKKFSELVS